MAFGQGQVNMAKALVAMRADPRAHSWSVPEKGKPERNIMDMGHGSSTEMGQFIEVWGRRFGIQPTGNVATRRPRPGGDDSKQKRKEERFIKVGCPTGSGAEPRGSASSSTASAPWAKSRAKAKADSKSSAGPWSRMQRRVEHEFGGKDPRMRHTDCVRSAVAAHVREEHGDAAPSHGRPPTQPPPDAETPLERSRNMMRVRKKPQPPPDTEPTRKHKRSEPRPQAQPDAEPGPEREARRGVRPSRRPE